MLRGFRVGSVYKTIRNHLEGSLDRLQTDYVDIYYLHRMNGVPVEKVAEAMGRHSNQVFDYRKKRYYNGTIQRIKKIYREETVMAQGYITELK